MSSRLFFPPPHSVSFFFRQDIVNNLLEIGVLPDFAAMPFPLVSASSRIGQAGMQIMSIAGGFFFP